MDYLIGEISFAAAFIFSLGGVEATLGTIFMQKKLNAGTVKKILAIILLLMTVKLISKIL